MKFMRRLLTFSQHGSMSGETEAPIAIKICGVGCCAFGARGRV